MQNSLLKDKTFVQPLSSPQVTPDFTTLIQWGQAEVPFQVSEEAKRRVENAYQRLMTFLSAEGPKVYGIHTGFGVDVVSETTLSPEAHQSLLLEYLCVGVGPALDEEVVRRALRIQAFKTSLGYSGVHPTTFLDLIALSNGDQLPEVPRFGSLGASGDLIPMAHAVSPIFKNGVKGPRDVLSLVNTNSMMSSYAIQLAAKAEIMIEETLAVTAKNSWVLGFSNRHYTEVGFKLPHNDRWTLLAAKALSEGTSAMHASVEMPKISEQARYSIRCAPQVLGSARWALESAKERIQVEALRIADNPVILDDEIWHGGHFYALALAQASDLLSDAIFRCAEMLDRQILLLVLPETNHGLPRNLEAPEFAHVKGIHQMVSALLQKMRGLSTPSRIMSFSCEGNNQDIVPCGMNALIQLNELMDLGSEVIRAANFVTDRAVELRNERPLQAQHQLSTWRSNTVVGKA